MDEIKQKKEKHNKKIIFIVLLILLLGLIALIVLLIMRSCSNNVAPTEDTSEISEVETYNKLINIANKEIDKLDEEHKDNKYDSNKLLSFTYNNQDVSYSTYNDNYLVNVSFKINSIDVINSILNDGYSEISVQIFDKYNYSLSENTYYQNTYVSNMVSYVGRITIVNHLSGTYVGNDEKIYSFTNIEFDNGDPCPYNQDSDGLTIYNKDSQSILYKLVYRIVQ